MRDIYGADGAPKAMAAPKVGHIDRNPSAWLENADALSKDISQHLQIVEV